LPAIAHDRSLSPPVCPQLYKTGEELSVAIAASLPFGAVVFYLVQLQGSLALFWLVCAVCTAVSTGGRGGVPCMPTHTPNRKMH